MRKRKLSKEDQDEEKENQSPNEEKIPKRDNDKQYQNEAATSVLDSLQECLIDITKTGDYAVEGEAFELPKLIGLEVDDYGSISVPLTPIQGDDLSRKYGGNDSSRCEIDASRVKIKNPKWNAQFRMLLLRVANQLGCLNEIRAKLHKLVMYKEGSQVARGRNLKDVEDQQLGTLLIQLPSIYSGGQLIVYNDKSESKKIDFETDEFSLRFAAYLSDFDHEIKPIESGYRLVLVYSLLLANCSKLCCTKSHLPNKVKSLLAALNNQPCRVGIMLKNTYNTKQLCKSGVDALSGVDKDLFDLLHNTSESLEVDRPESNDPKMVWSIWHVKLEIAKHDENIHNNSYRGHECVCSQENESDPECDHEWEEDKRYIEIAKSFDLAGNVLFRECPLKPNLFTRVFNLTSFGVDDQIDLIDEDSWGEYSKKRIRRGEEYDNHAYYESVTYSKHLLVFWPRQFHFDSLLATSLMVAFDTLYEPIVHNQQLIDSSKEFNFETILNHLARLKESKSVRKTLKGIREKFVELLIKFDKLEYAKFFLENVRLEFEDRAIADLAKLIAHFDFDSLKDSLGRVLNSSINDFFRCCQTIEILNKENQARCALDCWTHFVQPIVNDPKELEKIIDYFGTWNMSNLVLLFKLLQLFPEQSKMAFENLKTLMLQRLKEDKLVNFIYYVLENRRELANCSTLIDVYGQRKQWLEAKLREKPPFSWSMPDAQMPEHPKVEQFLRSDRQSMVYSDFKPAKNVHKFISKYAWSHSPLYSVEIGQRGSKSAVITKTTRLYEQNMKMFVPFEKELAEINKFLSSENLIQID